MKRIVSLGGLLLVMGVASAYFYGRPKVAAARKLPPHIRVSISGEFPDATSDRSVKRPDWSKHDSFGGQHSPYDFGGKLSYRAVIDGDTVHFYIVESIEIKSNNNVFQRDLKLPLTEQTLEISQCQPRTDYALRIRSRGKIAEIRLSEPFMTKEGFGFEDTAGSANAVPARPKSLAEPHVLNLAETNTNERIISEWLFFEYETADTGAVPTAYARLKPIEWDISVIEAPAGRPLQSNTLHTKEAEATGPEMSKGRWISGPKRSPNPDGR